jgi:serine/threonine protein kinase
MPSEMPLEIRIPAEPHTAFDTSRVEPWESERFELQKKLYDAKRNCGQVLLMFDNKFNRKVAIKQMPNKWICSSHETFLQEHPTETECPWQDVGCTSFLNSVDFANACTLHGVFRGPTHTYVCSSFATNGDLFSWCQGGCASGPERELLVAPFAVQILQSMKQLHDMHLSHRDISLENVLLNKRAEADMEEIQIIDYSMASSSRMFQNAVRGKASYQAPELHGTAEYDAFLTDTFAVGVTLYAMLVMDYPWLSTKPGGCKCFEYVRDQGFRLYVAKRKLRGSDKKVGQVLSEEVMQLLEGMLALNPDERLTLGERDWPKNSGRRSVWDEPWIKKAMAAEQVIPCTGDDDSSNGRQRKL